MSLNQPFVGTQQLNVCALRMGIYSTGEWVCDDSGVFGRQMWKYVSDLRHMQTLRPIKFNGGLTRGQLEVNLRGEVPVN